MHDLQTTKAERIATEYNLWHLDMRHIHRSWHDDKHNKRESCTYESYLSSIIRNESGCSNYIATQIVKLLI